MMSRSIACLRTALSKRWMRVLFYVMAIPLLPEYLAPVLSIFSLIAAAREVAADGRTLSLGTTGKVLLALIAYFALTVPFAKNPLGSLSQVALWLLMFLVYLALTAVLTDRKRLNTALYMLTLVAGIVGLVGCLQYAGRLIGLNTYLQFWEPLDRFVYSFFPFRVDLRITGIRVCSTFSNPNILGQYLVMVMPFTAYYTFYGARKNRRVLSLICLLTTLGCAAFTFSRGAYLALILAGVVLIMANMRHIVTVLIALPAALFVIPDSVWSRLITVGQLDVSTRERLKVWELCLELIGKDPFFGTGCGIHYVWSVIKSHGMPAPHAHNLILQILVEGGIVALCFLLFLAFRALQGVFTLNARRDGRPLGMTLLSFTVGFGAIMMVEYAFTFPKLMGIFTLVLAVADVAFALYLDRPLSPLLKRK